MQIQSDVGPTSLPSGFEPCTDTREEKADDAHSDSLAARFLLAHQISDGAESRNPSAGTIG